LEDIGCSWHYGESFITYHAGTFAVLQPIVSAALVRWALPTENGHTQIAIGRWSFVLGLSNQQPTSAELY
jgi:hypothetical protein